MAPVARGVETYLNVINECTLDDVLDMHEAISEMVVEERRNHDN